MKKLSNQEKIEILWDEVVGWRYGSDGDGDLEFAIDNDFTLWAVYLWLSSGASEHDFSVNLRGCKKELKQLINSCDTFTCPYCNHVGFYEKYEHETIDSCYGCGHENIEKDLI